MCIFVMEQNYVVDFYNNNSKSFDSTRYLPWPIVKSFVESVRKDSTICDVGCGNGKNQFRKDIKWTSCDNSVEMCKIVNDAQLCDCTSLPYKNEDFDHAICIAVIHHLSTETKRKLAINELIRITKPGGKILILVWALEQESDSRRKFVEQENFVDWRDKSKRLLGKRYYYVFRKDELEELIINDPRVKIIKSFYEKGNHGVILEKV